MVHVPFYEYFSNTFPPTFIKLIGLNFVTSIEVALPGFVMGVILNFFHFFGKLLFLKHSDIA